MNQHLCSFMNAINELDIIRCTECTLFSITFPHDMSAKLPCYAVIWDKDNVLDRFI